MHTFIAVQSAAAQFPHLAHLHASAIVGRMAQACTKGDPVCEKLSTYAGWIPGWLQYAWILGIGLSVVMGVIGHRRGWDHMREVITALIVASILISGAATFV